MNKKRYGRVNLEVLKEWLELKELITNIEYDIKKYSAGYKIPGVRSRRCMHDIRKKAKYIIELTHEIDKQRLELKNKFKKQS